MSIQGTVLQNHIRSTLGADPNPLLDGLRIVNGAGRWIASAHAWRFLQQSTFTLGTVADQDYIPFPRSCAEMYSVVPTDRVTANLGYLDGAGVGLNILRQSVVTSTETFWRGTIEHRTDVTTDEVGAADDKGGQLWPCLALVPTPSETDTDAFRARGRRQWTDLTKWSQVVEWPDFMTDLLIRAVMVRARGLEEDEDPVAFERYMRVVRASDEFMAATMFDGRMWRRYGKMQGAAVSNVYQKRSSYLASRVADPA